MSEIIRQLHNREWFSEFLTHTRIRPFSAVLMMALVNVIVNSSLATYSQTWLTSPAGKGLLADFQVLTFALLFQPTVIGTFCWFPSGAQKLFEQIAGEEITESKQDLQQALEKLKNRLQTKWLAPAAMMWGLFSCVLYFIVYSQPSASSWLSTHPIHYWFRVPLDFLFSYVLAVGFYDMLVVIWAINEVFRNGTIRMHPFHPDRAGGLGAIGNFSANMGYAVGAVGLSLAIILLQRPEGASALYNFLLAVMFLVYLILAPISFFAPLWSAHSAMLIYRKQLIKNISREFDDVFSRIQSSHAGSAEQNEPLFKRARQLDEERELIYRFPVWPFDSASVRKFFGLALSPLIPILTSLLLELLSKFL